MSGFFQNTDLLKVVLKWKVHLLVILFAAFGFSVLFTSPFFIPPKYKSHAVIYPSNLIPYGIETPTEQMLQLFQSNQIRDKVISRFKLAEHYGIDTSTKASRSMLFEEFDDNVHVSKTEFEAVELEVMDTDPAMAHRIALEMIDLFNHNTRMIHIEKSKEVVVIISEQMRNKKREIDSLSKELRELKVKFGIIDYKSQAKEASKEYYKSLGSNSKKTNDILVSIRNLEERGNDYLELSEHLSSSIKNYDRLKVEYDNALRDVEKKLTYTNVVVKPIKPDKKAYPVRWLICLFAVLSTLVFSVGIVTLLERYKK